MPAVNTNPSPKSQFMESSDNISKHRKLIESGEFQRAMHYALLQYDWTLCSSQPQDLGGAGANFLRSQGARQFLDVLLKLAEMPPIALSENRIVNLDHSK